MTNEVILEIERKDNGRILPKCENSKRLVELTGKKTFSDSDINILAEYFIIAENWEGVMLARASQVLNKGDNNE